jgi:hypothetical protein
MSTSTYPIDRPSCMRKDGPADSRFQIPGGKLLYNQERDARFPYIYEITSHALVHSPNYIKKILICIVDTSIDARVKCAKFEKTLSVPLGPNAVMDNYGEFPNLICFGYLIKLLQRTGRSISYGTWYNIVCPPSYRQWHLL